MTTRGGGSWLSLFLGRSASTATARGDTEQQALVLGQEDDWSDTSSEGKTITPEDKARLLPNMPTLFGIDLPPCGLIPQIAYENVVHRLRTLWLQHAAANPTDVNTLTICDLVQDELEAEAYRSPPSTERGTKARRPWRREGVFEYEIKWAEYFVREARMLEEKEYSLSEAEKEKRDFMIEVLPIPRELGIFMKNGVNKEGNLGLWRVWLQKKRQTGLEGGGRLRTERGGGEREFGGESEATASPGTSDLSGINSHGMEE